MKEIRVLKTCLIIIAGFTLLYLIYQNSALLIIAFSVNIIIIVSPRLAGKIVYVWDKIGEALGKVIPRILLALIYFGILVPIALLYRLVHKKRHPKSRESQSTFIEKKHTYGPEDFDKMW